MLTGLQAIVYRVPDLDRARQWYQNVIGRPPAFESPFVVIFAAGNVMLNLVPADATGSEPQQLAYWGVEDIDAAHQLLLAAGAAARGEIITTVIKSRAATLVDPFGNVFGIAAKPSAAKQSVEDQPSQSALGVTLFRAFAARDARPEVRGSDYLAEAFLPEELRKMVDNPAVREWVLARAPGSYEYFIARTAFFDAAVGRALDDNVPQLVLLGAGYDSRAYRFAGRIRETRIFELDVASTQQRKKTMLGQAGTAVPDAVKFVPVNFTRDSLEPALAAAGFDQNQHTLFVWEGVSYYLPAAAVDRTLASIRTICRAGAELCLDYMIDAPDMASRYGVAQSQALMRDTYDAEPIQFQIPEGTLEEFLAERGYAILEHLLPRDLEKNYLTLASGQLAGNVLACFGLVRAAARR